MDWGPGGYINNPVDKIFFDANQSYEKLIRAGSRGPAAVRQQDKNSRADVAGSPPARLGTSRNLQCAREEMAQTGGSLRHSEMSGVGGKAARTLPGMVGPQNH